MLCGKKVKHSPIFNRYSLALSKIDNPVKEKYLKVVFITICQRQKEVFSYVQQITCKAYLTYIIFLHIINSTGLSNTSSSQKKLKWPHSNQSRTKLVNNSLIIQKVYCSSVYCACKSSEHLQMQKYAIFTFSRLWEHCASS